MKAFLDTSVRVLVFVVFFAFMADFIAITIFPSRGDVSHLDTFRKLPNKFGFLWFITKPEIYFKKRCVKYVLVINYTLIAAVVGLALTVLIAAWH